MAYSRGLGTSSSANVRAVAVCLAVPLLTFNVTPGDSDCLG